MSGFIEVDAQVNMLDTLRNRANFLARIPVVSSGEFPSFEDTKSAGQCIERQSYIVSTPGLNTYFNNCFHNLMSCVTADDSTGGKLLKVLGNVVLKQVRSIYCVDLMRHIHPIQYDPPDPDSLFTLKAWEGAVNGRCDRKMRWAVWDPNQAEWLLQVDKRAAWSKMDLLVDCKLNDGEFVRMKLSLATYRHGELATRVAWGAVPEHGESFNNDDGAVHIIKDHDCATAIFKESSWKDFLSAPSPRAPIAPTSSPPSAIFSPAVGEADEEEEEGEFLRDQELVTTYKLNKAGEKVVLMNATIEGYSVIAINSINHVTVNFRRLVNGDGQGEVSLRGEKEVPPNVKYINFIITIPANISAHSALRNLLIAKNGYGITISERYLSIADFFVIMSSSPRSDDNRMENYGMQTGANSNLCVYMNAAVCLGRFPSICTHEEVSINVDPGVFEQNDMSPLDRSKQPSILLVDNKTTRFEIGNCLLERFVPYHMQCNTIQAIIAIASCTILASNYTQIVSTDVACVRIYPCTWLHSIEANTGKTTVMKVVQSVMGTSYLMTAGSTIPSAKVRAGQGGGAGVICMDDVAKTDEEKFKALIRTVAGEGDEGRINTNGTYVKDRKMAFAFTANWKLSDAPALSRLVMLEFNKLEVTNTLEPPPPGVMSVLSMLAPDLLNVRVDPDGVRDCAEFISAVTGLRLSRSDANSALALWATLVFMRMYTTSPIPSNLQMQTLLYFANEMCITSIELSKAEEEGVLVPFMRAIASLASSIDPLSANGNFFGPHVWRNVFHAEDKRVFQSGEFIILRVDQLVSILIKHGYKFKKTDITNALKAEGPHRAGAGVAHVRARWHDIATYPVSSRRVDVNLHTEHIMKEENIPTTQFSGENIGYVVDKVWFRKVVAAEAAATTTALTEEDIRGITLKSGASG